MAKITIENLRQALEENNEWLKQYVYDVITNFSPTSVNVARILSHLTNTTIHITPEDKHLWDSSFERAKNYCDEVFQKTSTLELKIVGELPSENIMKNAIYLLETSSMDVYEQFVYSDGKWVSLGTTSVNMENFYTREQVDAIISELKSAEQHTHKNKEILDLITAAFTLEEKRLLEQLAQLDATGMAKHIKDSSIHMSEADREVFESLKNLDADSVKKHIENTVIHLTAEQVERYDSILQTAKDYTDSSIETLIVLKSVEILPDEPAPNTLYLVPAETPSAGNLYDKYLYIGDAWEKLSGGGSSSLGIDFSQFVTTSVMENYVSIHTHNHSNKSILDLITEAFTTELKSSYDSNFEALLTHAGNDTIHLSTEQIRLISSMATIDDTIKTIVNNMIQEATESGQFGLKPYYVDELPTNLSSVNKNVIYFVRRTEIPSESLADDADITNVDKTVNYDKYIWSDEYGCWEIFNGSSMELTDDEVSEILNF